MHMSIYSTDSTRKASTSNTRATRKLLKLKPIWQASCLLRLPNRSIWPEDVRTISGLCPMAEHCPRQDATCRRQPPPIAQRSHHPRLSNRVSSTTKMRTKRQVTCTPAIGPNLIEADHFDYADLLARLGMSRAPSA